MKSSGEGWPEQSTEILHTQGEPDKEWSVLTVHNQTMTLRAQPRHCRSVSRTTQNPWKVQKDPWPEKDPPTAPSNLTELNLQRRTAEYSARCVNTPEKDNWGFYLLLKVLQQSAQQRINYYCMSVECLFSFKNDQKHLIFLFYYRN